MLILNSSDVEYCFVKKQLPDREKILPALTYKGVLFVKLKSYAKNKIDEAIEQCKKILDQTAQPTSIIVKHSRGLTLWLSEKSQSQKNAAIVRPQPAQLDPERVYYLKTFNDLATIVARMSENIDNKSKRKFLRLVSQKLIIDRDKVLQYIQNALLKTIGPISEIVYHQTIESYGAIETLNDVAVFVNLLKAEITCGKQSQRKFARLISQNLVTDRDRALDILQQAYHRATSSPSIKKYRGITYQ